MWGLSKGEGFEEVEKFGNVTQIVGDILGVSKLVGIVVAATEAGLRPSVPSALSNAVGPIARPLRRPPARNLQCMCRTRPLRRRPPSPCTMRHTNPLLRTHAVGHRIGIVAPRPEILWLAHDISLRRNPYWEYRGHSGSSLSKEVLLSSPFAWRHWRRRQAYEPFGPRVEHIELPARQFFHTTLATLILDCEERGGRWRKSSSNLIAKRTSLTKAFTK